MLRVSSALCLCPIDCYIYVSLSVYRINFLILTSSISYWASYAALRNLVYLIAFVHYSGDLICPFHVY